MKKYFLILPLVAVMLLGTAYTTYAGTAKWSLAKSFLKQGDYPKALLETEKVLKKTPDDIVALRLKANILLALKRDAEAVETLRKALQIDTESVATKYYLGKALLYAGGLGEAMILWNEVITDAPESMYAQHAMKMMPKLESTKVNLRVSDPKKLKVIVRAAREYDTNVSSRAKNSTETSPKASGRFVFSGYLKYDITKQRYKNKNFSSSLAYSVYQSYHDRKIYNDYDVTSQNISFSVGKDTIVADKDVKFTLKANVSKVHLANESYSDGFGIGFDTGIVFSKKAYLKLGVNADFADYKDDSAYPVYYNRDGKTFSFDATQYFYFMDNKFILAPHYKYINDNTDGMQFRQKSYHVGLSTYAQVACDTNVAITVKYMSKDYEEFTPDPKRLDDVYSVTVSVSRGLLGVEGLNCEISYNYKESFSSRDYADYERSVTSMAVNYEF